MNLDDTLNQVKEAIGIVFPWAVTQLEPFGFASVLGDMLEIHTLILTRVASGGVFDVILTLTENDPNKSPHPLREETLFEDTFVPDDRFEQHLIGWLSTARAHYNRRTYRDRTKGSKVEIVGPRGVAFIFTVVQSDPYLPTLLSLDEPKCELGQCVRTPEGPYVWCWTQKGCRLTNIQYVTAEDALGNLHPPRVSYTKESFEIAADKMVDFGLSIERASASADKMKLTVLKRRDGTDGIVYQDLLGSFLALPDDGVEKP